MKGFQILLLTSGLIFGGILLSRVSVRISAQNSNSNTNAANRYSNTASNRYSANAVNSLPMSESSNSNAVSANTYNEEYDFNFGEVPKFLKIISTERKIVFPKNGEVTAQVIEEVGKPFIIRFVKGDDEDLLAQFVMNQNAIRREYFHSLVDPKIRLKVINIEGVSSPLIHMVIAKPGGSDYFFWSALFGEVNGKIKLLTPPTTTFSWEGGVKIGDLGKGNGVGVAVWNSIWGDGESHYGEHIYQVDFYNFNKKLGKFVKTKTVKTKQKEESPAKALDSLGLGFYKDAVRDFPEFLEYRENF